MNLYLPIAEMSVSVAMYLALGAAVRDYFALAYINAWKASVLTKLDDDRIK